MRTRAAQIILAVAALFFGAAQPVFDGLSMLALAMLAVAGILGWMAPSGTPAVRAGADSEG